MVVSVGSAYIQIYSVGIRFLAKEITLIPEARCVQFPRVKQAAVGLKDKIKSVTYWYMTYHF